MKHNLIMCFIVTITISCNYNKIDHKLISFESLDISQSIYLERAWYYKKPNEVERWIDFNIYKEENPLNFFINLETLSNTIHIYYGNVNIKDYDTDFVKIPLFIRKRQIENIRKFFKIYTSSCLFMRDINDDADWIQFMYYNDSMYLNKFQVDGIKNSIDLICVATQKKDSRMKKIARDEVDKYKRKYL